MLEYAEEEDFLAIDLSLYPMKGIKWSPTIFERKKIYIYFLSTCFLMKG